MDLRDQLTALLLGDASHENVVGATTVEIPLYDRVAFSQPHYALCRHMIFRKYFFPSGGPDAWISEIRDYLNENILPEDHVSAERIVRLAKRYTVVEGDLYRRGANDILMRCITLEEGREILAEIHRGECGSHSSSRTLVGKAFQHSFY